MRILRNCRELLVGSLQVGSQAPQTQLGQHLLQEASQAPDLPADGPTVYLLEQAGAVCEVSTPRAGSCRGVAPLYPQGTLVQGQPESDHLGSQPVQHPPRDYPTHTRWGAAPEGAAPLPGAPSGLLQAGEPTGPPAPQAKDCMAHTERQAYLVYSHPLNSRGLYRDIRREATQRLSLKHRHEIEGSRGMQAALAQRSTFLLPCHWEAGQKAGRRKGRSGQIREGAEPGGARPRVLYQAWPPDLLPRGKPWTQVG